tara:strand:+ start:473 stop:673 length:201 start_codon:yes stop_codon:yes gene_type:complete
MIYWDYNFDIGAEGLKLTDKGEPDEFHMVQIDRTPLKVGDKFTLELDEHNRMFFRKDAPVQMELGL